MGKKKPAAAPAPAEEQPLQQQQPTTQGNGGDRKPPAHTVRLFSIKATIWENHGAEGRWFSITLGRSYKQGTEWRTASSFGVRDLPIVAAVCHEAMLWIAAQPHVSNGNGNGNSEQQPAHQTDEQIPF